MYMFRLWLHVYFTLYSSAYLYTMIPGRLKWLQLHLVCYLVNGNVTGHWWQVHWQIWHNAGVARSKVITQL